jgi:hypothetical protein
VYSWFREGPPPGVLPPPLAITKARYWPSSSTVNSAVSSPRRHHERARWEASHKPQTNLAAADRDGTPRTRPPHRWASFHSGQALRAPVPLAPSQGNVRCPTGTPAEPVHEITSRRLRRLDSAQLRPRTLTIQPSRLSKGSVESCPNRLTPFGWKQNLERSRVPAPGDRCSFFPATHNSLAFLVSGGCSRFC